MSSANFKLKRTAAASRGFLATARFSCYLRRRLASEGIVTLAVTLCVCNLANTFFFHRMLAQYLELLPEETKQVIPVVTVPPPPSP